MLKLTLLALPPVWAVLFGSYTIFALSIWHLSEYGVPVLIGGGVATLIIAFPISFLIARRMLVRRERRLMKAQSKADTEPTRRSF